VTKANTAKWFSVSRDGPLDVFLGTSIDTLSINMTDVPEPATLGLVGLGLAGLGLARRCKQTR
jgi:hypothetical protein